MVFSSLTFLFAFLPVFFLVYFLSGKLFGIRGMNLALLLFSLFFYAWGEPVYVLLMLFSICANYGFGLLAERAKRKRGVLALAAAVNLSLIIVFKYSGLFVSSLNSLSGLGLAVPEIALPIGISFYTFQALSYVVDVCRGEVKAQRSIISFGAYISMFPQLIAGPIVRYETVAPQIDSRKPREEDIAWGIRRFLIGLGKKTLIANTMAATADALAAYGSRNIGALGSWISVLAFTLQIYFDFSGYSDMAIGLGRMLGFSYLENFNSPYCASSITDFWRRWHISLSSFFRDYVYIPMGGNRVSRPRWLLNLFTVWFLTGLWHGASWNFVLWGLYYGLILVAEKLFMGKILKKSRLLGHLWSLLLIVYGWVIFSRESLAEIAETTKAMFGAYGFLGSGSINAVTLLQQSDFNMLFIIAFAAGVLLSAAAGARLKEKLLSPKGSAAGDLFLGAVFLLSVISLMLGSYNPFIYFRF